MGLIYDVSKIISEDKLGSVTAGKFNQFRDQLKGPNSITKMARQSVMSYPVIISEGVIATDENLVSAICKYLEVHYSIFTMIAMSLNPILDGTDPRSQLVKFYSEEGEDVIPDELSNSTVEIVTGEKIVVPQEFYKPYNETKESEDEEISNQELADRINSKIQTTADPKEPKEDIGKHLPINYTTKVIEKTRLSEPTIINVKFKMASTNSDIEFPIAVKANPNYITNTESSQIFTYLKEDKPLVNLVKLLSGEINLFKDILFQVDKAKEDKRLYSRLGRHPWFRQLLIRKNSFKIMNFLKGILGKKVESNIMPMCSLVVTRDEIERGLDNIWDRIKEKECKNIVDKLMLLSFCVVDTTTNTIEISFYGLKNNTIMRTDHLIKDYSRSGSNDKSSKDFEKLLQALIYKM